MNKYSQFLSDLDGTSADITSFIEDEDGCYIWQGALNAGGYPEFSNAKGKIIYAHRFAYEHANGTIPAGKQWHIHHLCRKRACIRDSHLRLVHASVHCAMAGPIAAANRTHCNSGKHAWIPENIAYQGKVRLCRPCRETWLASPAYKAQRKAYRASPEAKVIRKAAADARRAKAHQQRMIDEPGWLPRWLRPLNRTNGL